MPGTERLRRGAPDLGVRRLSPLPADVAHAAAEAQRAYWGRVLAGTMRLARDLDIAEEATADAFVLALQTWPERGIPQSVEAWLITAARRRAIDKIRRASGLRTRLAEIAATTDWTVGAADEVARMDAPALADDELRLVVLCCHPALALEAQVALTLRLGCGAPTAAIASAFLVSPATMAARLTRAKQRVATSGTGIDLPDDHAVDDRLPAVRRVVHLAYTLGPHRWRWGRPPRRRSRRPRDPPGPHAARRPARRPRDRWPARAPAAHPGQGNHAARRRR